MKKIAAFCMTLLCVAEVSAQNISLSNQTYPDSSQSSDFIQSNSDSISNSKDQVPGNAVFIELLGKGYISGNFDFKLTKHHHVSAGLTQIDYTVYDTTGGNPSTAQAYWCPGFMYYFLSGKTKHFLELGTGASFSLARKWDYMDSPVTIHGVVAYRYQKKNGFLFRAGFTPLLQPPNEFWPLVGISLGYSW